MKVKFKNIFNADQIIISNLDLQSTQRSLQKEFGVSSVNYSVVTGPNFLKQYDLWDSEKKNKFIKTIGGVVHFKKVKEFIDKLPR
jgi:hypothetical protein